MATAKQNNRSSQHFSCIYVFVETQNTFSLGLEAEDQIRQNICQPPESDP